MEKKCFFQNRLKQSRINAGLTQKQMATFLEMTPNAYQKYELGTREPSLEVVSKLADYFDVPVDYLLGRGLFAHWDDVVKYRLPIIEQMEKDIPSMKEHHLKTWPEKALMRFLPAFLDAVIVQNDTLQLFYYSG